MIWDQKHQISQQMNDKGYNNIPGIVPHREDMIKTAYIVQSKKQEVKDERTQKETADLQ